jgi:hypothetical protein
MFPLQAHRLGQGAQRSNGSSLPAYHLAHIARCYAHFNKRRSLMIHLAHIDRVNIVNQ